MNREHLPILNYTHVEAQRTLLAWQSIVAGIGGLLGIPLFLCICGHLGKDALLATIPTVLLAWWGFARRLSICGKVLAATIAAFASAAFIKNLLDIGWFGHDAVFR